MRTIHLLDEACINKIAAGEIVDRPAHVVKELVENAIDAGASQINIELRTGGIDFISVQDDGHGMDQANAHMAIKRHATSKIKHSDDLCNVSTMGFRGEALAAISAVSHFTLSTKVKGMATGSNLSVEVEPAGRLLIKETPWNDLGADQSGTRIQVAELFYNTPARLKFLKSSNFELRFIVDWIKAYAIAFPTITFRLSHNGSLLHHFMAHPSAEDHDWHNRIKLVLDPDQSISWISGQAQSDYGRVRIAFSAPGSDRPNSLGMLLFVNRRWVQDKNLKYAVLRAYHSHLLSGRYPVCVVDLQADPTLIDQNVHPTKTEIRLQYAEEYNRLVVHTIRDGLRSGAWAEPVKTPLTPNFTPESSSSDRLQPIKSVFSNSANYQKSSGSFFREAKEIKTEIEVPRAEPALIKEPSIPLLDRLVEAKFLGSFAQCYLLFEHQDYLISIDQHAFHERILFERYSSQPQLIQRSERFLLEQNVRLNSETYNALKEHASVLQAHGFEIGFEPDHVASLKAVPALLKNFDPEALLEDMATAISSGDLQHATQHVATDIIATLACHTAIRAGENVSEIELHKLLVQAKGVDFFHNCPHGRRVFRIFKDLKSNLGLIVSSCLIINLHMTPSL